MSFSKCSSLEAKDVINFKLCHQRHKEIFFHFASGKNAKKKRGKDCLVLVDNQGNYFEQLRIMLPRLMYF